MVGNDPDRLQSSRCGSEDLDAPTATERKALGALNQLANACLKRQGRAAVQLKPDLSWGQGLKQPAPSERGTPRPVPTSREGVEVAVPPGDAEGDRAIASCVGTARREQLSSYVASPALLFIGDTGGATVPGFDLSTARRRSPPSGSTAALRTVRCG